MRTILSNKHTDNEILVTYSTIRDLEGTMCEIFQRFRGHSEGAYEANQGATSLLANENKTPESNSGILVK